MSRTLLTSAPKNCLTDVNGVHAAHFTLAAGDVQTGLTIILPYPLTQRNRKLFLGSFASANWNEWTGLHVAQDFGTFSSPMVLCNPTTLGIAYDALITFGHQREAGLPIDNAWPPLVIGMDDGYLNEQRERRITHDDVLRTIHAATNAALPNGSVGIGRGLCAFGGKGGVGTASRTASIANVNYTVGAMLAANGGQTITNESNAASLASSFVLILATDAPLLPETLRQLAEAGVRGLDKFGLVESEAQQLALAFSTTNVIDNAFEEKFQLFQQQWLAQERLAPLCEAAAEAASEALRKGLQSAEVVTGRKGRKLTPVDWRQFVKKHENR